MPQETKLDVALIVQSRLQRRNRFCWVMEAEDE